jgi:hypothetical protein
MGMAYQEVDRAFALTAGSLHEFDAKLSDAGAGVKYYFGVVTADFHARSVAAGGGSLIEGEGSNVVFYRLDIIQVHTTGATQSLDDLILDFGWRDGCWKRSPHTPEFHFHKNPAVTVEECFFFTLRLSRCCSLSQNFFPNQFKKAELPITPPLVRLLRRDKLIACKSCSMMVTVAMEGV